MKDELDMNANLLVEFLQKPSAEFTKADIVSYIKEKNIRMVNFMYPAGDGRLKTLNFVDSAFPYGVYRSFFRIADVEHAVLVL